MAWHNNDVISCSVVLIFFIYRIIVISLQEGGGRTKPKIQWRSSKNWCLSPATRSWLSLDFKNCREIDSSTRHVRPLGCRMAAPCIISEDHRLCLALSCLIEHDRHEKSLGKTCKMMQKILDAFTSHYSFRMFSTGYDKLYNIPMETYWIIWLSAFFEQLLTCSPWFCDECSLLVQLRALVSTEWWGKPAQFPSRWKICKEEETTNATETGNTTEVISLHQFATGIKPVLKMTNCEMFLNTVSQIVRRTVRCPESFRSHRWVVFCHCQRPAGEPMFFSTCDI